jgi:hypothetical protein
MFLIHNTKSSINPKYMGSRLIWHVHIYKLGFHTQKLLFCFHFIVFSFFAMSEFYFFILFLIQHLKKTLHRICIKIRTIRQHTSLSFGCCVLHFFGNIHSTNLLIHDFVAQINYQQHIFLNFFKYFFMIYCLLQWA